jgi:Restriction endonuclease BglII
MYLTSTYDDPEVLPPEARQAWLFLETNSAAAVMKATAPVEWAEICSVLSTYRLKAPTWLAPGGNRGDIAKEVDKLFLDLGWAETRLDLETIGVLKTKKGVEVGRLPAVVQEGYAVDNFKGRIVVDVEWNAKDGNLDRDLAAYRSWYEAGVISAAVLITKDRLILLALARELWNAWNATLPEAQRVRKLPVDLETSTTTSFDKAALRIRRGVMGTCPVLIVAGTQATWDGQPYRPASAEELLAAAGPHRDAGDDEE